MAITLRPTLVELADAGDIDELKRQIGLGREVDEAGADGRVALHVAFAEGLYSLAKDLLARGADANRRDSSGYTVIHWAARSNQTAMLELAKDACGYPVDVVDNDGRTALSWVSQGNDVVAVEWLLGRGADPNAVDVDGWGPLHYAAADGNVEVIKRLLSGGALPLLRLPPSAGEEYGESASDLARNFAPHAVEAESILDAAEEAADLHSYEHDRN